MDTGHLTMRIYGCIGVIFTGFRDTDSDFL